MNTTLINPLEHEVETYEAISKAIIMLKGLIKMYGADSKHIKQYIEDVKALYKVRENYIIAKSIDIS